MEDLPGALDPRLRGNDGMGGSPLGVIHRQAQVGRVVGAFSTYAELFVYVA